MYDKKIIPMIRFLLFCLHVDLKFPSSSSCLDHEAGGVCSAEKSFGAEPIAPNNHHKVLASLLFAFMQVVLEALYKFVCSFEYRHDKILAGSFERIVTSKHSSTDFQMFWCTFLQEQQEYQTLMVKSQHFSDEE